MLPTLRRMAAPRSSYYDRMNRPTPALIRARAPFMVRNAVTGVAIFGLVIGIYSWTISAVSQDEFTDVVPDPEAQAAYRKAHEEVKKE